MYLAYCTVCRMAASGGRARYAAYPPVAPHATSIQRTEVGAGGACISICLIHLARAKEQSFSSALAFHNYVLKRNVPVQR